MEKWLYVSGTSILEKYTTIMGNYQLIFTENYLKINSQIIYYNEMKNIKYKKHFHFTIYDKYMGFYAEFDYKNKHILIICDPYKGTCIKGYFELAAKLEKQKLKNQKIKDQIEEQYKQYFFDIEETFNENNIKKVFNEYDPENLKIKAQIATQYKQYFIDFEPEFDENGLLYFPSLYTKRIFSIFSNLIDNREIYTEDNINTNIENIIIKDIDIEGLIDIILSSNTLSINQYIMKNIDIFTAIIFEQLLTIYNECKKNNRLDKNDYFYISYVDLVINTDLSELQIQKSLMKLAKNNFIQIQNEKCKLNFSEINKIQLQDSNIYYSKKIKDYTNHITAIIFSYIINIYVDLMKNKQLREEGYFSYLSKLSELLGIKSTIISNTYMPQLCGYGLVEKRSDKGRQIRIRWYALFNIFKINYNSGTSTLFDESIKKYEYIGKDQILHTEEEKQIAKKELEQKLLRDNYFSMCIYSYLRYNFASNLYTIDDYKKDLSILYDYNFISPQNSIPEKVITNMCMNLNEILDNFYKEHKTELDKNKKNIEKELRQLMAKYGKKFYYIPRKLVGANWTDEEFKDNIKKAIETNKPI